MTMASPHTPRDVRIGSGRSAYLPLAGSAAFVIFGIALIASPRGGVGAKAVGVLTVLVFGAFFLLGLRLLRAGGMYVLTAGGIHFPYHKWPMLPWADVQGTRIITRRRRRYLAVDVRDTDARVRHMKSGARVARQNLRAGLGLVPIPEQMSPTSLEELQREIERRRATPATAAVLGDEGMTILPKSASSVRPAGLEGGSDGPRGLRNVAILNAVLLPLAMLRFHTTSTHRVFLVAAAVALLVGAAALQLQRILTGVVIIVAAAIVNVAVDLTVGGHVALATRILGLFLPVCVVFVALASWPRRRAPW
jgi:hypothetical protein